ncbi:hypothetical protein TRFO_40523 [Tritrichomonas foetus]|uniref:Uncharacterized protein n=1 Tax=Tritrichomonas foetus TaxID=1144522 RepID=A0A1J4J659_9EUKA|nr:hypothetical protein TRFO_40523 [Tritrichomonas foetus]|eukprot:OHS93147.1 hypothetical protein TRFO_40523 [Tritrichomonas foetus]
MTSKFKSSFDSSILDQSTNQATINDIYESIGLQVLDRWDTDQGDVSLMSSQQGLNLIGKLEKILNTPSNKLKPGWSEKLRAIIEEMEPTDFAIYGKRISLFLLSNQDREEKLSITQEAPISITFGDQGSASSIPITPKPKANRSSPKSRRSRSPRTQKSQISQYSQFYFESSFGSAFGSASPKQAPQRPLYTQFPKWLPTLPEFDD